VTHNNDLTQSLASVQVHGGLEINSSCDDIIRIFIVGYVCYSTVTGGSSQHSAVVLFDLYVAASEIVFNTHSSNLCITFVIAGNFDEILPRRGMILFILKPKLRARKETNNS